MILPIRRALLLAVLAYLVGVDVAGAHAALDTAEPGPDEVVSDVPAELVATFTEDLDASRSSIELRDAAGARLARGGRDTTELRVMRMALPDLAPAVYTVRWTSFSGEDGELARGAYTFTVVVPGFSPPSSPTPARASPARSSRVPSATPTPTPTVSPSSSDTAARDWSAVVMPIVVAIFVVGGIGAWLVRGRST